MKSGKSTEKKTETHAGYDNWGASQFITNRRGGDKRKAKKEGQLAILKAKVEDSRLRKR